LLVEFELGRLGFSTYRGDFYMYVVTAEEMYLVDDYTINQIGISEDSLMENAGQAVANILRNTIKHGKQVAVLAGTGNNGGDGFVIARALQSYGHQVELWLIPPKEKLVGAAKKAMQIYENSGYKINYIHDDICKLLRRLREYDYIIDALLGIGMKGKIRSPYREIIDELNLLDTFIYSVDIPSGVPANGGEMDAAIKANVTITLQAPKLSAFIFPFAEYYGELMVADIGVPPIVFEKCAPNRAVSNVPVLPARKLNSHKGIYGKGLVIGGSSRLTGAVVMTAKAALRSGAGLITMAVPDSIHPICASHFLEAMYLPCTSKDGYLIGTIPYHDLDVDAIAIGPGLGRTDSTKQVVKDALERNVPIIIDADGLYQIDKELLKMRTSPTIITPHPGEMASLLGISIKKVEENRFELSKRFALEYGVFIVLKGPYTIVTTPSGEQFVNTTGNPALAKGGSGDVLTGIILALTMQSSDIKVGICNAVYIHGKSADLLIEKDHTNHDVLATDVIEAIPLALREITSFG